MTIRKQFATLAAFALVANPAIAADDPNAAATAETARLNAETARINAEAALINAKASKDKADIAALGLPKFENKTELAENGGAIETAMLASKAVKAAGVRIHDDLAGQCVSFKDAPIVVLAGNETFDLNYAETFYSRLEYHKQTLDQATNPNAVRVLDVGMITGLASAAMGLIGNDTKVTGVALAEINDAMLASAVAGALYKCAFLPSAGAGIAKIGGSRIGDELDEVIKSRNKAAEKLAGLPEKPNDAEKRQTEQLKAAIAGFDEFYKVINTPDTDKLTPLIRAVLVDRVTYGTKPKILRVTLNRAGGTITNSKNIVSFFGGDPVRVSGGLVATYLLVDASTGAVLAQDTLTCQTAQTKLRNIQSGNWSARDEKGNKVSIGQAFCGPDKNSPD